MKTFNLIVAAMSIAVLHAAEIRSAEAATLDGVVVGVMDGDTIDVLDRTNKTHRIRLAGIDAPEKAQAFGNKAKYALSDLVYGKQVTVNFSQRDMYARIIGAVTVGGVDINHQMVGSGYAWVYRVCKREEYGYRPIGIQCTPSAEGRPYLAAENMAIDHKTGLWADAKPVAPWDWRRVKKDDKKDTPVNASENNTEFKGMALDDLKNSLQSGVKKIIR